MQFNYIQLYLNEVEWTPNMDIIRSYEKLYQDHYEELQTKFNSCNQLLYGKTQKQK